MSIHPLSFLLGLGAAVALPAIAKVIRPIAVEVGAAGMALYDETIRIASEGMETLEDVVAEVRAKREAVLTEGSVDAGAGVGTE